MLNRSSSLECSRQCTYEAGGCSRRCKLTRLTGYGWQLVHASGILSSPLEVEFISEFPFPNQPNPFLPHVFLFLLPSSYYRDLQEELSSYDLVLYEMVTEKKKEEGGKKEMQAVKTAAGAQRQGRKLFEWRVRGNHNSVGGWGADSIVAGATGTEARSSHRKGVISGGWKEPDGKKEKQPKKKKKR